MIDYSQQAAFHDCRARLHRCPGPAQGLHSIRKMAMQNCECCGNTYDKAFELTIGGTTHVFDSLQCAIHVLAPRCAHCQVPIIGHGIEARGQYFCCAHCARKEGIEDVTDRAPDRGAAPP